MTKTAFITGANRGLGVGFVDYLLDQGYVVFAGSRSLTNQPTKNNLHWVEIDLADDASIERAYKKITSLTDHLDLLINNAGVNKDSATHNHKELVSTLQQLDRSSLLTMFSINSIAPMLVIKTFLPLLTSTPSFVINISSCRASYHDEYSNSSGNYGYRGSKIALNMFTFGSVQDLPANVLTFAVHPGGVKSDMNPTGNHMPYDQAKQIIAITANWDDKFNGQFLRFDGNLYPL